MHRRKKRQVTDANGNRVLRVVKRDATEMAEVETTERIIQVKKNIKIYCTTVFSHQVRIHQHISNVSNILSVYTEVHSFKIFVHPATLSKFFFPPQGTSIEPI